MYQKNLFTEKPIKDIKPIPQYGKEVIKSTDNYKIDNFENYLKDFFAPWRQNKTSITKQEILKKFDSSKKRYAENFEVYPYSWYQDLIQNANLNKLEELNLNALIIRNTSLRNMPTLKPAYYNPNDAGEGYPFDTIQENLLRTNEPVFISHFTYDKKFAFVKTNARAFGFIESEDLALIDKNIEKKILESKFVMVTQDDSHFDLGMLLPLNKSGNALIPFKLENSTAKLIETKTDNFINEPLAFNKENIAKIIDVLINKPYGWGGYLGNRDCAQLVKDYFACFGIHMPIFSGEQVKIGNVISLENLNNDEKIKKITKEAIECRTILYTKGHVVIYLGLYNNEIIIFHARWGVSIFDKNNDEYRHIIGKSIISSLEFGKELEGFDQNKSSFLRNISAMSIIG